MGSVFEKKRSYSGRSKSLPSGSALPTVPPTLPPFTSTSLEAGCPAPPPPTPPSEGHGRMGSRRASLALALVGSPPPPAVRWERRGLGVLAFGGECDLAASSLPGVGAAGPSNSQGSSVLAALFSVASSASAERDRSRSRKVGGSTEDLSRSCS